jgi:hypothetical protein
MSKIKITREDGFSTISIKYGNATFVLEKVTDTEVLEAMHYVEKYFEDLKQLAPEMVWNPRSKRHEFVKREIKTEDNDINNKD